MSGALGPWALALAGNDTVCVCFSSRRTSSAAEAGVWTRLDYRGQRLAAATVAAWTTLEMKQKKYVFYSTARENSASRSVAIQLGMSEVGWIWKVQRNS